MTLATRRMIALCGFVMMLPLAGAALAKTAPTELTPDGNGDVTISAAGHYVETTGDVYRTITINASDVRIDGLTFIGGAAAAIKNGFPGLANVTIENCSFQGYTGRTITYGFAEGVASATHRGSNWKLRRNVILQGGNNATAIALFNIDGVELAHNQVAFVDGTTGRRGFNLDGSSNVTVVRNTLRMSDDPHPAGTGVTPWAIQISMSDAPVSGVKIDKNTIFGTFYGVVGLSQRDMSGLKVMANNITATRSIALNSGGAVPVGDGSTFSDVKISGNKMTVSQFGVQLRDLHAEDAPVLPGVKFIQFIDVNVTGNTVFNASGTAQVINDLNNPNVVYDVKVKGNKLR